MKTSTQNTEKPKLVLILGAVAVGKTTLRRQKYTSGYTYIDAGDIFIELSKGEYYDFPSHLEQKMIEKGRKLMKDSIKKRHNIVLEFPGSEYDSVEEIINLAKQLGYECSLEMLQCDIELAWERNINRGDDNISSYYYEQYHLDWFKEAAHTSINLPLSK
jgi:GTPase SAR1 family protein